ncbi:MAG: hypothetical protein RL148_2370 [Planctomycetota bacterium]
MGGIATIGAVALVCLFLVWVVLPLLRGGSIQPSADFVNPGAGPARVVHLAADAYLRHGWVLRDDGSLLGLATADGRELARAQLHPPGEGHVVAVHGETALVGSRTGAVHLANIRLDGDEASGHSFTVAAQPTLELGSSAVVALDHSVGAGGPVLAVLTADRKLHLRSFRTKRNLLTGKEDVVARGGTLDLQPTEHSARLERVPEHLLLSGAGDNVYLVWQDGTCLRVDTRDLDNPAVVETVDLTPEDGTRLTAAAFLIGKTTLAVGDDRGAVHLWFRTKPEVARGSDGSQLERARVLDGNGSPVRSIAPSERSRLLLCGHEDGSTRLHHATSGREVAASPATPGEPVVAAVLGPKEDGILTIGARRIRLWALAPGHPEVTLAAISSPVWYEGYERAEHVWQSTSGTDDFEPKFGLWPLVFGTLKATLYCLLFGVPLALLAAVYTSEFLHPRTRGRIKPLIELMASLPSVVLGFLAALVFAPVVEQNLARILAMVVALPVALLLGATLWQSIPPQWRPFAEKYRFPAMFLALPASWVLAGWLGTSVEWLAGGDLKAWLAAGHAGPDETGATGPAFAGWWFAFLPLGAFLSAWVAGRSAWCSSHRAGGVARMAISIVLALGTAAVLAGVLTASGADLRGELLGTYVQRNALVVGFVMGFAVIPIIYTIAEDALSAVPEHLRAASLGAGATQWQTATRIILPTAMSGIFSAVMVGLGRAVGETMIVLMAAGNTPVLELNPFNGFRTLSANIAVELPEAVRDSTHYRMLYLAALVLFAFTFALNTVAELVRQRFRKRAFQL